MLLPRPKYREDKATEAAARFLEKAGGEMRYVKLIKLLYLMDRKALITYRRPVTYDRYYSLDKGPILSVTKDLMIEGPTSTSGAVWVEYISPPMDWKVQFVRDPRELRSLSDVEIAVIDEVFDEFGAMGTWDLVNFTHTLPEWHDPDGGALPFDYSDILIGAGLSGVEIKDIEDELREIGLRERFLG